MPPARDIEEATLIGIFLEKACRAQLAFGASGFAYRYAEPAEPEHKRAKPMTRPLIQNFWQFYNRELHRGERT